MVNEHPKSKPFLLYALLVWVIAASFFLMDYAIRVSPSVMGLFLMSKFNVGAFSISVLAAIFLYPYVVLQPFVGALVDRYGPSRILFLACSCALLGMVVFVLSKHVAFLYCGRLLIGMGCSFSFVGTLKIVSNWLPKSYFTIFTGITQTIGMLGGYLGEHALSKLSISMGWNQTLWLCTAAFFLLCLLMLLFVRDRANDRDHFFRLKKISPAHQPAGQAIFASIKNVIRIRKVWLNCIYNGSLYVPMGVFAGLWGVPFLIRLENLSLLEAASQVAYVFVGAAFGAPLFGILSNVLKSRLWVMRFCSLISLLFVLFIIYGDLIFPAMSDSKLMISLCLFAYGLSTGGVIPSYAYATESVAKEHQGIAIGLTNMASLGIGACMMPAVGILLDLFWHGAVHHQHPVYSLQTYQYALVLLPISMLFACVSSFLLREKSS